jgi:hypothetical protein
VAWEWRGVVMTQEWGVWKEAGDNPNTTHTLEYTKDKYNVKIRK